MPILKFDHGWHVIGKAQRPLKDAPEHFFVNTAQLICVRHAQFHLTTEQVAVLPVTDPPRVAGDYDGYLLVLTDDQTFFVVETEAEMSTRLVTLASG